VGEHKEYLRHDDRVIGLDLYILGGILTFDNVFVIEGDARLATVWGVPKHVDPFLLGEVPKPPERAIASSTVVGR